MNKLQEIVNKKWFPVLFFTCMVLLGMIQHYRVFSLDIIGYHSWRQTQTQTVIGNFAAGDMNILYPQLNDLHYPGGILRMEFPLMQWCIALLYKVFGNHLIITRLFCFSVTILSALGMYKIAKQLTSNRLIGLCTAWLFFFSPEIYYYCMNPIPDNLALCCGIWAMYFWFSHLCTMRHMDFIISCVLLAISIAVKLPFIVFGGMYLSRLFAAGVSRKRAWKYLCISFFICLPALLWYAFVIGTWTGNGIVMGIAQNNMDLSRFFDILQHNLISTLPELLVNYATLPLFVAGLYITVKKLKLKSEVHVSLLCVSLLASLYFFYEMNMIAKVHDYYLFPFIPLIFLVIAKCIHYLVTAKNKVLALLLFFSFMLCPLTAYLRSNSRWNMYAPGFSKEYVWYKKQLQGLIPRDGLVVVEGDASRSIVLYHLHRRGWSYDENSLAKVDLESDIDKGAAYLIFDCHTDEKDFVKPYLDSLLFQKGDVKLYKLKTTW